MGSNSGFTFSKTNQLLTVTGSANIGGMNIVPTITSAYAKANAANVLAQAAFDKANTGSGGSGNANTSGWLANTVIFANTGGYLSNTNNLQFFTSNNVLQVPSISTNGITTSGISGNISGANYIYANNYIANTGGYFQFADGTRQYTANADSVAYN